MAKKTERECSFCGQKESEVIVLLEGNNGATICERCVERASEVLGQVLRKDNSFELDVKTPREIKDHLDQYIIGQDDAKKVLSVVKMFLIMNVITSVLILNISCSMIC